MVIIYLTKSLGTRLYRRFVSGLVNPRVHGCMVGLGGGDGIWDCVVGLGSGAGGGGGGGCGGGVGGGSC